MKTVILAGGFGTRLAEYTDKIPKPMVQIGGKPILSHIMNFYQSYGHDEFIVAAGYKKDVITEYYKNSKEFENLNIVDTGENTMTGGRILRLKSYFDKNENFFMTYGDGLCSINLDSLIQFHLKHKKIASVTAVHPPVRFGELEIKGDDNTGDPTNHVTYLLRLSQEYTQDFAGTGHEGGVGMKFLLDNQNQNSWAVGEIYCYCQKQFLVY